MPNHPPISKPSKSQRQTLGYIMSFHYCVLSRTSYSLFPCPTLCCSICFVDLLLWYVLLNKKPCFTYIPSTLWLKCLEVSTNPSPSSQLMKQLCAFACFGTRPFESTSFSPNSGAKAFTLNCPLRIKSRRQILVGNSHPPQTFGHWAKLEGQA